MIAAAGRALDRFSDRFGTQYGPEADLPVTRYRVPMGLSARRRDALLGATIYANATGYRNADTFNPEFLRMPVFDRIAPRLEPQSRIKLACAAAAQHVVQYAIGFANLALAGAHICVGQGSLFFQRVTMRGPEKFAAFLSHEIIALPLGCIALRNGYGAAMGLALYMWVFRAPMIQI